MPIVILSIECYGPNYRRTFGRIKTVGIWPPIWRVDRIVENFGEDEADRPMGSSFTISAVTDVTPIVQYDRCERPGIELDETGGLSTSHSVTLAVVS